MFLTFHYTYLPSVFYRPCLREKLEKRSTRWSLGLGHWRVLVLRKNGNIFLISTWKCLMFDRLVSHFSRQEWDKLKWRFCRSFQSEQVEDHLEQLLTRLIHTYCIQLTSLLFLGIFFIFSILNAKLSLTLSYLPPNTSRK